MSSQRRTIMGAVDYSIASLQNLKKALIDVSAVNPELNWAVGGVVASLVSNLIQICDQVFQESKADGESTAQKDLQEIGSRLNAFIDRMVTND